MYIIVQYRIVIVNNHQLLDAALDYYYVQWYSSDGRQTNARDDNSLLDPDKALK